MGHRLPNHNGPCKNIHGHSYKMIVELEGEPLNSGMMIDFYDLNIIIKPILEQYDHAFLCWSGDKKLLKFLSDNEMKTVKVNYYSTVENICNDFTEKISVSLRRKNLKNIREITVKIFETPNSFAELTKKL